MLSVKFICVGRMREKFYIDAFAEYEKRLRTLCRFELTELTEQRLGDNPSSAEISAALDREAQDILKAIPADAFVTAMCVEGRQMPSEGMAKVTLSRPKTETSVRKVSIPQEAVDLLVAEHKKHPDNPYMFPSPATGEMYYPDSVVNLHKKILKDAGLPHIRFHDLRHTFATLALQNGVDVKTVSSMLGHYDAGFTLRTYTHATRQKQDEAAQTMGSFMAQVM